jgi:hypothetical protein
VVDGAPVLTGFLHASSGADPRAQAADRANLLASSAALVGNDRAIAALVRTFGTDALVDLIPVLQMPALARTTQAVLGTRREAGKQLDALRNDAAAAGGVDLPQLVELHRISANNLLMMIGTLIAAGVLLGQVGSPQEICATRPGGTSSSPWCCRSRRTCRTRSR